jgi:hypothetical protein
MRAIAAGQGSGRHGRPTRPTGLPALAIALLLAACGGGAGSTGRSTTSPTGSPAHRLSVSPAALTRTSRVTFTFIAPVTAGRHGPSQLSFVLTLAGPRHAGCLGPRTAAVSHAVKGRTASVQLGGNWCVGAYTAEVQEFARPFCKPGQMCPQYVRLVGTVASARFRVSG